MHHDYLASTEGVSLERIQSCDGGSSCWTSSASSVNYGTPAKVNSQNVYHEIPESGIELAPELFSPDMDGFDDLLTIRLPESETESVLDLIITDLNGNLMRTLLTKGIPGEKIIFSGMEETMKAAWYCREFILYTVPFQKEKVYKDSGRPVLFLTDRLLFFRS